MAQSPPERKTVFEVGLSKDQVIERIRSKTIKRGIGAFFIRSYMPFYLSQIKGNRFKIWRVQSVPKAGFFGSLTTLNGSTKRSVNGSVIEARIKEPSGTWDNPDFWGAGVTVIVTICIMLLGYRGRCRLRKKRIDSIP
jgi:hypothetical protein